MAGAMSGVMRMLLPETGNPTGDYAGVAMVSRGAEEAAGGTHTCAVLLDARGHARASGCRVPCFTLFCGAHGHDMTNDT